MEKVIKRYENRKMYDTSQGSYVSLDDIKEMVRSGDTIKVVDNTNDEDITVQTLTQIVLEESKNGRNPFSSNMLHNVIRWSNNMFDEGFEQVKHRLDDLFPESIQDFLHGKSSKKDEFNQLKNRVEQLESSLQQMIHQKNDDKEN